MKIIRLEAENTKRLRAIEIMPKGDLVIVGGRNGQGKSSTLDAIEMALGGAGTIPPEPIRRGARKARIVVDLGDLIVERVFTAKGTQLVVKNAEGVEQRSPQALLDSLCSRVAFDPLAFARMDPRKQDEVLKKLLNIDFTMLDQERASVFAERAHENKAIKELKARLDAMPHHPDAPAQETSVADLMAELERREELRREHLRLQAAAESTQAAVTAALRDVELEEERIAELEKALAAARANVARLRLAATERASEESDARAALEAHTYPDPAEIKTQLQTVEQTNRLVRANAERAKLKAELRERETKAEKLTDRLINIDNQKAGILERAEFPVPGLGFDDAGPTLNGIPLEQASQAERLRVSVAIGIALNPKLRVLLVRDGSLLDDDSMRMLAELAAEHDCQVWLERVGTGDPTAIVIEDGEVLNTAVAAEE